VERKWLYSVLVILALLAWSCGSDDGDSASESTTTAPTTSTTQQETTTDPGGSASAPLFVDEGRVLDAPVGSITVDGDDSDWADIDGLAMTLSAIGDEDFPSQESVLKVAHDDTNVYVLMQVDDDFDLDLADPHLSASSAIQWAVESGAGEAMGSTDDDRETSLGLVDIWHWELECAAGEVSGGATSDAGEGNDPGNDAACNFDDEYARATEEREDDNGDGAENSLAGSWSHTSSVVGEAGTWTFEISRPLNTGDAQDAQFEAGSSARVAIAYWDADTGPDGWEDKFHVQSANQGWITVNFS
jgi:hypothetical protein